MNFEFRQVRVVELSPIANSQWSLWVKDETSDLPPFQPGQFCMLSMENWIDPLLPRPYAIVERKEGMYRFIYRVDGKFTKYLSRMWRGARLQLLGPVGLPAPVEEKGMKVFIAGGVGYSSLYSLLQSCAPDERLLFYGVRSDLDRIPVPTSERTFFSSDDGSVGYHGRIHELLLSKKSLWEEAQAFYICGPTPMMKSVHRVLPTEKSYYFLEETMGCGVGICMGCVVPVKGSEFPKRSCLEGPVFRGDRLEEWMKA